MTIEQLFDTSFLLVAPFWILMILLPFWSWTERIVRSPWIAIGPALIYLGLVLPNIGEILAAVTSPSLEPLASLMGEPVGATIAWVHFLAFDLFVARWVYLDSRVNQIFWLFVSPILYFVLMLGPIGFVGYLVLRTAILAIRDGNWRGMVGSPV
ncbi:MAG: ABA4-like family protein [Chloroflexota bacterium]